jgi:hypothetical protein
VGYKLSAQDDSRTMFGDDVLQAEAAIPAELHRIRRGSNPVLCPDCGRKLDSSWVNPKFRVGRRSRDACATYDGYFLVSYRFKQTWEAAGHDGAVFQRLPNDTDFYSLRSDRIVAFDADRAGTRRQDYCSSCEAYATVVGARPAYLLGVERPLERGLYRTDLEFACDIEQHPLLIVSPETRDMLVGAGLKGLEFSDVFG